MINNKQKFVWLCDIVLYLTGRLMEVLQFDESRVYIEGLAYDWMNHNLYYTDTGSSEIGLIHLQRYRHFKRILLGPNDVSSPRGIVVDPVKGYVP